jgi:hypothetical protein
MKDTAEDYNMSTQYTPGPWVHRNTPNRAFGAPDIWCIDWSDDQQEVAEIVHGEANARLIASAPDLLAALDAMVNMIDYAVAAKMNGSISNCCPTTEKARAAIAKAKVGAAWVKIF